MIPYSFTTLPVTLFFIGNAVTWLYYGLRLKRVYETHNFTNTILTCILWVVAGVCFPFFYLHYTLGISFFQILSECCILGVTPTLLIIILYYQKKLITQKPEIEEQRTLANVLRHFKIDPEKLGRQTLDGNEFHEEAYSLKTDVRRKIFHFVPAFAIIGLWIFATRIWADYFGLDQIWQISGKDFGIFLILTVGFSGIFVFATLEYLCFSYLFPRWNVFPLIPGKVSDLLFNAMKPRELTEFIKPIALILAMVPIFFLPFSLFASVTLGATLAMVSASVFGKAYGQTHFAKEILENHGRIRRWFFYHIFSKLLVLVFLWIFHYSANVANCRR